MNVTQIKDAIRYMSRSDKIEIDTWLDGELVGDLLSRIASRRSIVQLPSAKKSNGRGSWTTNRGQLLGKDVDVRAIGRRRETYSVRDRF